MKDEDYLARLLTRRQSDLLVIEGGAAREREDWAEAFRLVMQAVKLDPGSYNAHIQLAQFYKEKDNPEAAVLHFEKALAIYPKSLQVVNSLIPLDETIGRQDKAAAAEKKIVDLAACYQRPYIMENGVPVKMVNKMADMQDLHQLARKAVARELLQLKMYLDRNNLPYSDHMSEHWLRTWEYTGAIIETDVDSRMKILDVGGTGTIFSYYLALQGCLVTTVDIDEKKVADAVNVSLGFNLPIDHRCVSITDVEFAENEFDRIYCICVIEHLTPVDQKTALKRMARFLKPGGLLYMTFDVGFNAADFPIVDEEQIRERYIGPSGLTLVGNSVYQFEANDLNINHPDYCFGSLMLLKPGDGVRLPLVKPAISIIKYE